ncbi:MAG: hypothetical protein GY771_08795, partial [bacterium]|nr:hypothetical protein [bacterium]
MDSCILKILLLTVAIFAFAGAAFAEDCDVCSGSGELACLSCGGGGEVNCPYCFGTSWIPCS